MQGIARAVDGRGPETRLQAAFQDALNLNDPRELIGYLYHTDRERSDIAGLSRLVFTAAEQGDVVACEVLRQAIQERRGNPVTFFPRGLCAGFDGGHPAASAGFSRFFHGALTRAEPGARDD